MQLEKIVLLKLNDKRYVPTLPKEMQSDKKITLQSEFRSGTRDLIRGFNPVVERIVLPDLIGLQANEPEFAIKARDFWADFSAIPTVEGLKLNVATEKKKIGVVNVKEKDAEGRDTGKIIEQDEMIDFPVNPTDYMVYQIALQSSKVAKTPEELANLSMYDFYIVDLAEQIEKEAQAFNEIDKADAVYMKLVNESSLEANKEKINWVLELLRDKGESIDVESLDILEKKKRLRSIKESEPRKFVLTVEDNSLAIKAKIIRMYSYGVITKEGKEYFDGEINIGEGKAAVAWFSKAENSSKVLSLDARLREAVQNRKTL